MDRPERVPVSRRTLLKGLGAGAVGGAALLGIASQPDPDQGSNGTTAPGPQTDRTGTGPATSPGDPTATPTERTTTEPPRPERRGVTFDRSVDVVADFDADPTGTRPVNRAIESAMEPGTLLTFPPGTYQLAPQTIQIRHDRIGFLGAGDVTWRFADGFHGRFINCERDEFVFEGIDLDTGSHPAMSGHMRLFVPSRFYVGDVAYIGRGQGPGYAIKPAITDSSTGRGTIRNFRVPHGARPDMYESATSGIKGNGRIGLYAGQPHVGILEVLDCEFSEFGNNGIYASRTRGDVRVEDSYFLNNGGNGIRLSGEGSWAKRCTVEVDTRKYDGPPMETSWGTWGITCENSRGGLTTEEYPVRSPGMVIEDCDVVLAHIDEGGQVGAGIRLGSKGRQLRVRNTRIQVDVEDGFGRSTHAVLRVNPYLDHRQFRADMPNPPKPHAIHLEDVEITGSAAGASAVRIAHAEGSTVRNCRVRQPGRDRDGVRFIQTRDSTLDGGSIRTTGYPLVVNVDSSGRFVTLRNEPELVALAHEDGQVIESVQAEDGVVSLGSLDGIPEATINVTDYSGGNVYGTLEPASSGGDGGSS